MLHCINAFEDVMKDLEAEEAKERARKKQLERRAYRKNREGFEVSCRAHTTASSWSVPNANTLPSTFAFDLTDLSEGNGSLRQTSRRGPVENMLS